MEGNEGPDLAQDMKKDAIETEKYYENVNLELSKIRLENVMIEEKYRQEIEAETEKDIVEYGVYIKFNDEDVKIATIDEEGILIPNVDILKDEKYSDEDRKKLGDIKVKLRCIVIDKYNDPDFLVSDENEIVVKM